MKLRCVQIKNYRSLVDVKFEVRDLTVIIGPNGSGKTALLEILQLLQKAGEKELSSFLELQGGYGAVRCHHGRGANPNRISVELEVNVQSEQSDAPMSYRFELGPQQVGYA